MVSQLHPGKSDVKDDGASRDDPTLRSSGEGDRVSEPSRGAEPRLTVITINERPVAEGLCISLEGVDELVLTGGRDRAITRDGRVVTLKLEDKYISRPHVKFRLVPGGWELEDVHSMNRTRVNGALVEGRTTLEDGNVIAAGRSVLLFRDVGAGSTMVHREGHRREANGRPLIFPTLSHDLELAFFKLAGAVRMPLPMLLYGESGTGKELVARRIHELSGRSDRPFKAINCGAIPTSLIESELFGYRRGAFSGANSDYLGHMRSAHGGTLFLDEIGELPPAVQVAFLRVLQEQEVTPIGSTQPIPVDIRIVGATNCDLRAMVQCGTFRKDLFARLAGHELPLPPLRERREDLGILIGALLEKLGRVLDLDTSQVTFDRLAAQALLLYDFPRNVRELELALKYAVGQSGGGEIQLEHLPQDIRNYAGKGPSAEDRRRRERLIAVLRDTGGNMTKTAAIMSTKRITIRRWCKKYGINPEKFRGQASRGPDRGAADPSKK